MKLKKMTDSQLHKLVNLAQDELLHRKDKARVVLELKKQIKNSGYTIDELIASNRSHKVAPKWRHKEDASLTWAGRGRQPKWIKKYGVKV